MKRSTLELYSRCLLVGALGSVACGEEAPELPEPIPGLPAPTVTLSPTAGTPLAPTHGMTAELSVAAKGPRRLSVEELERSWEAVAELPAGSVQLPESLARSMGEPDWMAVTEPSYEASPLFMKLMMDIGASLCGQALQADAARPPISRVILPPGPDVDLQIRELILRFWGIDASASDHPDVVRLRAVYDATKDGMYGEASGWWAVCIALSTSPEFLLF